MKASVDAVLPSCFMGDIIEIAIHCDPRWLAIGAIVIS
jgi:hypothetical protein